MTQKPPTPALSPALALATGILLLVACLSLLGCDSTAELARQSAADGGSKERLTSSSLSPGSVLRECAQAYQELSSYEDRGFARLRYQLDGEPMEDLAPLAVAWDRQGRIGLKVYAVQAGPSGQRWRLRLRGATDRDGDVNLLDSHESSLDRQVLSRAVPSQVSFDWLLSDPVVVERLAAGLAGFPPQLDLLLSPQPLGGLFDGAASLSLDPPELIEQRLCQVVKVGQDGAEYRLWIEQATGLLRRVQIPSANLLPHFQHDSRVSGLQLTIELEGIRINSPIAWDRFEVPSRPDDLLVHHFVNSPPVIDVTGLGVKSPAFTLDDPSGDAVYSSVTQPGRKATVLLWLADHPACRAAAEQLSRVAKSLAASGSKESVEFVCVWAEPTPPPGLTFQALADAWRLPGVLTLDRAALGRDLFEIQEAPTLIVLDGSNRVQLRETRANPLLDQVLPGLLKRIVDGEDLSAQLISKNRISATRHVADLALAASIDAAPAALPESYEPGVVTLTELSRQPHSHRAVAVDVDDRQLLWRLSENGQLESFDAAGKLDQKLQTAWNDRAGHSQLSVAPGSSFMALLSSSGQQLEVFGARTASNTSLNLSAGTEIVDMRWLRLEDASSPRLAVIQSDAQSVLFDPTNREQLSGPCPAAPLAIVGYRGVAAPVGGLVVLADQSVEPLEVSDDSSWKRSPGRPAAHLKSPAAPLPKKLGFKPDSGPWTVWEDSTTRRVLARGWLADDEPALFLLDDSLSPLWHHRMPRMTSDDRILSAAAHDPATGQAVWAVSGRERAVHLLRADGASDHFRVRDPLVGLALLPSGSRLLLVLVHPDQTARYELRW